MVVVMEADAGAQAVEAVVSYLVGVGADVHRSSGQSRTLLGVVGNVTEADGAVVAEMPGVARVVRVSEPYRLASRRFRHEASVVSGAWGAIGGDGVPPWIAIEAIFPSGPSGPSSLPYEVAAGRPFDAAVHRRAEAPEYLGSLASLSLHPHPISAPWPVQFVTRDPSWSVDEWICAAERELVRGERQVVLLEAGSAHPDGSRTLEITHLVAARLATHLPVVVDVPRIATRTTHAASLAAAAVAAGANGVILRASVPGREAFPRAPVSFGWEDAAEVADRLRRIGQAARA